MQKLTNDEKAKIYNTLLFQYQRIQEEIRQIKAKNFEISFEDQRKVNVLQERANKIYNDTRKLYM